MLNNERPLSDLESLPLLQTGLIPKQSGTSRKHKASPLSDTFSKPVIEFQSQQ